MSIINEAKTLVIDRNKTYGPVVESFQKVADMFLIMTGIKIRADHVALLLKLAKMVRSIYSKNNKDHYVDDVGYTSLQWDIISSSSPTDEKLF